MMSQNDWVLIGWLAIGLIQIGTALLILWGQRKATQDIRKIELATNSMKDALVAATQKSAHAEGLAEGKQHAEDAKKKR